MLPGGSPPSANRGLPRDRLSAADTADRSAHPAAGAAAGWQHAGAGRRDHRSLRPRARAAVGYLVKIELEVDSLAQLDEEALEVDAVPLDNMGPDLLREAVRRVDGRMITGASGRISAETAPALAATGATSCRSAG